MDDWVVHFPILRIFIMKKDTLNKKDLLFRKDCHSQLTIKSFIPSSITRGSDCYNFTS